MKKLTVALLIASMTLGLVACGNSASTGTATGGSTAGKPELIKTK